jgi:hypothetical protein
VIGLCGVMLRRATSLIGLPDVGDPFDVAAFRAFSVPDDQNAFVMFRQAADKLRSTSGLIEAARRVGPTVAWSQADPGLRAWFESNRDALALFRQATLRPDGIAPPSGDPSRSGLANMDLGRFVWLILLDSSRLEDRGDMAAAWDGYRTILRMKTLIMRRGTAFDREFANQICQGLGPRITTWAADPKTDVALIRRALSDVQSLEPKPEWDAHSLKCDYLQALSMLDRPNGWAAAGADEDILIKIGGQHLPPNLVGSAYAAYRFLVNEPERSRRVLRLACANWLSHIQEQDPARRKPAVRACFSLQKRPIYLSFFAPGPDASSAARALSPQDLARWAITTRDAKVLLFQWPWPAIRTSEMREHRALVIRLADELYHRDHGSFPLSEQALVGPYLDHLPDDGSNDLDDGTAPKVDDSAALGIARPE